MHIDDAVCPACRKTGLEFTQEQVDLPYLGESLETMLRCEACGYRHVDFILTAVKDPTRFSFRVTHEDHMSVRVVRSGSGTIRIPELGISIEPGVASEAFISNVEGVLVRIERVLGQLGRDAEESGDRDALVRVQELQDLFNRMRLGTADPVTLILEDPFGNSAIIHPDVIRQPLTEKEAAGLKVGAFVFEQNLDEKGEGKEEEE